MEELLKKQAELMEALGVKAESPTHFTENPSFLAAVIGISTEASETLDELSIITKPWKKVSQDDMVSGFKEEFVDILFMWLEVMLLAGMSWQEIEEIYHAKFLKNLSRILKSDGATSEQRLIASQLLEKYK